MHSCVVRAQPIRPVDLDFSFWSCCMSFLNLAAPEVTKCFVTSTFPCNVFKNMLVAKLSPAGLEAKCKTCQIHCLLAPYCGSHTGRVMFITSHLFRLILFGWECEKNRRRLPWFRKHVSCVGKEMNCLWWGLKRPYWGGGGGWLRRRRTKMLWQNVPPFFFL